jgi:hypothetical protein
LGRAPGRDRARALPHQLVCVASHPVRSS